MCKISSCVRATFSFCRSVRYLSIGVSPTHSKLYGTASPFLQCFARRESLLPQLRRDRSEFTGAGQVLLRLSSVHPESKAPMRCGTQPSACFRALRFTMPTSVWVAVQVEPLPNILLTNCRQNLSQTIRKAPEIVRFQELFLELLGRFELPTSSLPTSTG